MSIIPVGTGDNKFKDSKTIYKVEFGKNCKEIGENAFEGCINLKEINDSNVIESIGQYAFANTSISDVKFNKVNTIGNNAFESCTSLSNITICSTCSSIGNSAFKDCSGLTSIKIPNSVTTIGMNAFSNCEKLSIYNYSKILITKNDGVAQNVKEIYTIVNDYKFIQKDNKNILIEYIGDDTKLNLPDHFFKQDYIIGDNAFKDNTTITSITIPNSVTSIGNNAFYRCSSLVSIEIPNSVTTIGSSAFYDCSNLKDITIGSGVTTISNKAFNNCNNIDSLNLNCNTIGNWFSGKSSIKKIVLGDKVRVIGNDAFIGCHGLTSIVVAEDNTIYDSREDCNAIIETATNTLITGCKNTVIPNSVTTIGEYAFGYCDELTSITIPNSVTTIGNSAFECCTSLTSVTIGNSVTTIGDYAFHNCSSLTSIEIPNSVTTIEEGAFAICSSLASVTIGNSVTTIGERAFENCINLETVEINENGNRGLTSINNYAFKGCKKLTTLNLPEGLENIGKSAFENCIKYTIYSSLIPMNLDLNDTLPTSLKSIGNACFKNTGIETLIITNNNNNLKNIPESTFENCKNLITLNILNSNITTIGSNAFYNCNKLLILNLPNKIEDIGDNAFNSEENIDILSVTLPSNLKSLGNKSLYTVSEINVVSLTEPPKFTMENVENSESKPFNDSINIYITKDYIDKYKKDTYWSNYNNNIYNYGYIDDYIKECYIKKESDESNNLYITFYELPVEWIEGKIIFNTYNNSNVKKDEEKRITFKSNKSKYSLETKLDYPSNNNGQTNTEVGYLKIENSDIPFINDKKHTIILDLQAQ